MGEDLDETEADADARRAEATVPRMGLTASDRRFGGKMETRGD
jgi:hypothetical protein